MVGTLEHQAVRGLAVDGVVPDLVVLERVGEVGARLGALEAGVEQALAVAGPLDLAELHVTHDARQVLAGGQVADTQVLHVRATGRRV